VPESRLVRRLLTAAALVVATGLLVLGAIYQADTPPEVAQSGTDQAPTTTGVMDPAGAEVDPIEGWFPSGGQAAACTEPVGVALATGYQAALTINGVPISDSQLNDRGTAGGSLNRFTWGPEADCPRGTLLRPEGNVVEACVWRVGEPASGCRTFRFQFDAL
jgi:hypothetical protein